MADSGLKTIERWATAAICAAAMSFAHAQPLAASTRFRQPVGPLPATFLVARPVLAPQPATGLFLPAHNYPEDRLRSVGPGVPAPRGLGQRRLPMPRLIADGYRPVSENARRVPPPSGDAVYMRAGSIRDAVTRYNEERESGRIGTRPTHTGARPPDPGPNLYRN
jgi:hypothetical protein